VVFEYFFSNLNLVKIIPAKKENYTLHPNSFDVFKKILSLRKTPRNKEGLKTTTSGLNFIRISKNFTSSNGKMNTFMRQFL
jgi:hypothetical protein